MSFMAGTFLDRWDSATVARLTHQNLSLGSSPWCQGLSISGGTNVLIQNKGANPNGGGHAGELYSADLTSYVGPWGPLLTGFSSPTTAASDAAGNVFVGDGYSKSIDGTNSLFRYTADGTTQLGAWDLSSPRPYRLSVGKSDGTVWWVSFSADTTLYHFNPISGTALSPIVVDLPTGATSLLGVDMCSLPDGSFVVYWDVAAGADTGLAYVGHYGATGALIHGYRWSDFSPLYGGVGGPDSASGHTGNGSVGIAPDGHTLWIVAERSDNGGWVFRVDLSSQTILSGAALPNYDGIYWSVWTPTAPSLRATPRTSRLYRQA